MNLSRFISGCPAETNRSSTPSRTRPIPKARESAPEAWACSCSQRFPSLKKRFNFLKEIHRQPVVPVERSTDRPRKPRSFVNKTQNKKHLLTYEKTDSLGQFQTPHRASRRAVCLGRCQRKRYVRSRVNSDRAGGHLLFPSGLQKHECHGFCKIDETRYGGCPAWRTNYLLLWCPGKSKPAGGNPGCYRSKRSRRRHLQGSRIGTRRRQSCPRRVPGQGTLRPPVAVHHDHDPIATRTECPQWFKLVGAFTTQVITHAPDQNKPGNPVGGAI